MLFMNLAERLEERGHQVFKATRRYREVLELLRLKGVEATVVGEHGGEALADKLKKSASRTLELAALLEGVDPDVSVTFSSPEMARASFGLRVPHVCINDSPHAEAVARLTVPLSDKLLTPWIIPKSAWTKYGIPIQSIVQYRALDPWIWLKDFKPDARILKALGLDRSRPVLTFRPEESFAAYLLDKARDEISITDAMGGLLHAREDLQIVALPRYEEQIDALQARFRGRIIVPTTVIDGPSLLHYTSVFVGAGGTMSAEAAILGVPTISCYPGEPFLIEKYLMRKKLVIRETDPEKVVKKTLNILDNAVSVKRRWMEKSKNMVQSFVDPIEVILEEVEKYG